MNIRTAFAVSTTYTATFPNGFGSSTTTIRHVTKAEAAAWLKAKRASEAKGHFILSNVKVVTF